MKKYYFYLDHLIIKQILENEKNNLENQLGFFNLMKDFTEKDTFKKNTDLSIEVNMPGTLLLFPISENEHVSFVLLRTEIFYVEDVEKIYYVLGFHQKFTAVSKSYIKTLSNYLVNNWKD